MDQTTARQLAVKLSRATGSIHVSTSVPRGSWGGTETGWDVDGPITDHARTLRTTWQAALDAVERSPAPTDRMCAAEQTAYDALVDFVDAQGLTYTEYDPRGTEADEDAQRDAE